MAIVYKFWYICINLSDYNDIVSVVMLQNIFLKMISFVCIQFNYIYGTQVALSATYLKWSLTFLVVESMPILLYGIFRNTYNHKFYYNESNMGICGRSPRLKWFQC